MVLGYDEPRPKKEHYQKFFETLSEELNHEWFNGVSLLLYGSFVREDYNPKNNPSGFVAGRSDADGVLIFPETYVTNKETLKDTSDLIVNAHHAIDPSFNTRIPFQVTVTDLASMQDKRFNPYPWDFKPFFENECEVISEPDYRPTFQYNRDKNTHPSQDRLIWNLRKARQGLLFSQYHLTQDYTTFLEKFNKSLEAASQVPKQILSMTGHPTNHKFSSLETFAQEFPQVNLEPFNHIQWLFQHPPNLDALYKSGPKEVLETWNKSLTFMEESIKSFAEKFSNKQI